MIESLRKFMKAGCQDYDKTPRKVWVLEKFSQIVMTVSQIAWSRGCEEALRAQRPKDAMKEWLVTQKAQLAELSALVRF